jgi:hypothetical protein
MKTEMKAKEKEAIEIVLGTALGYLVSRSLHVATELGIADMLKAGAKNIDDIALEVGANPQHLYRLLRVLAMHGIFAESDYKTFSLTPAAELLQRGMMRDGVLLCGEVTGDGSWWKAVGVLKDSVVTGEPAFERLFGKGFFEYIESRPNCREWFDRGMANFSTGENSAIASSYNFSIFRNIMDIGGGQGGFLTEILKLNQNAQGTLFDVPEVVENPAYFSDSDLEGRWEQKSGDFFAAVPENADAYILKRILHDWSDERCIEILRSCRRAMSKNSVLLVIDSIIPSGNTPHSGKVMDILMMVFAEGRERTEADFQNLFEQAGLKLSNISTTPTALTIIEALPI